MTSQSDYFNRIASEEYDADQIQEKIKLQKQAQSFLESNKDSKTAAPRIDYIAPRTPTEKWLADTIAEWLELERVSIDEDFFELGGDSMVALRIFSRIRDQFQIEISPGALFFTQFTVAKIAQLIDKHQMALLSADELTELIGELGNLSDEDVKKQLNQEK